MHRDQHGCGRSHGHLHAERQDRRRPRRTGRSSQTARGSRRRDSAALLHGGHARRTATAERAWSRSRASACSRRRAAVTRKTAWRSRPTARARSPARRCRSSCCSSDVPETSYTLNSELDLLGEETGVGKPRFAARPQPVEDLSHPAMAVHLDACIQCKRCVRACREEQVNDVIGYAFRGGHSKIVFDLDDPMGDSTCVACGECVQACPTGALMPARDVAKVVAGQDRRLGLPVLRRRLPAHLQHQGQPDSLRRRAGRSGEFEPSVRQGPLRVRLRAAPAPADEAAHPEARRPEAQGLHRRSGELARGLPRGDVG